VGYAGFYSKQVASADVAKQMRQRGPFTVSIKSPEEEITIGDLVRLLWKRKWWVAAVVGGFALAGLLYALVATPRYQAEVVVMPVGKSPLSGSLGQLGGLASLAGISIDSGDSTQGPLAVLKSKALAREFIEKHGLVEELARSAKPLIALPGGKGADAPDIRDALTFFDEKIRRISEDRKSGLIMLDVTWSDGRVAADWANELIANVNGKLRAQAEAEAEKNVSYLQREIAGTSVPSLQQSLSKILEGEMQKLLLAKGNDQFAFKVIDPAMAPRLATFPKKTLIVIGSTLLGLILAVILVILLESFAGTASSEKPRA
jgi:uncharacterized protein involved in exopolysaccharide biosynthesis